MKRFTAGLFLVLALLVSLPGNAQVSGPTTRVIVPCAASCTDLGQVCIDGTAFKTCNGATYAAPAGGSAVPVGAVTQVQFYDTGDVFGGDAGLTYAKATDILTVAGGVVGRSAADCQLEACTTAGETCAETDSFWFCDGVSAFIRASGVSSIDDTSVNNQIVRFHNNSGNVIQGYTSGGPTIGDTGIANFTEDVQVNTIDGKDPTDWATQTVGNNLFTNFSDYAPGAGANAARYSAPSGQSPYISFKSGVQGFGINASSTGDMLLFDLTATQGGLLMDTGAGTEGNVHVRVLSGDLIVENTDNSANALRLMEPDASGVNYHGFDSAARADDLVLTWNITKATCTGDGNGGTLTVNGSDEIVCAPDDGGAGASQWTDEGTVLRPSEAADEYIRVSGDANAAAIGSTTGNELCFAPAGGASPACSWFMNNLGDLTVNSVTTTPSPLPTMTLRDSNMGGTPDVNAHTQGDCPTGSTAGSDEDCDVFIGAQAAGSMLNSIKLDTTDGGARTVHIGAIDTNEVIFDGDGKQTFAGTAGIDLESGTAPLTNIVLNEVLTGTGAGTGLYKVLPSCSGAGEALNYNNATQTWGCITGLGAGGVVTEISGDTGGATTGASITVSGGQSLTTVRTTDTITINAPISTKCINVDPDATTTNWFFYRFEEAVTITSIDCIVDAATSVVMTLQECNSNGGTCGDTEAALTCLTTNTTEVTSVDDPNVDAGDWMRVTRGAKVGSPTQATICMNFTVD